MRSLFFLAGRHRLATLIGAGSLLLAAAAPVTAHHQSAWDSTGAQEPSSKESADSARDEIDGWQAGEFRTPERGTANQDAVGSSAQPDQTAADDSADVENSFDDDSADVPDASGSGSPDVKDASGHDSASGGGDGQGDPSSH